MLSRHCLVISGGKGFLSRKCFVSDDAQRILVGGLARHALKLLRSHIRISVALVSLFIPCFPKHGLDTKVGQQRFSLFIKEDVFWFEIAVNNISLMSIIERLSNLQKDVHSLL